MLIHGKERKFKLTIGASVEIAKMCPDGDLGKLGSILEGSYADVVSKTAVMISAMNKGYEEDRKYSEKGYNPDPITPDEILTLSPQELSEIKTEVWNVFEKDSKITVETEPSKKKEATKD